MDCHMPCSFDKKLLFVRLPPWALLLKVCAIVTMVILSPGIVGTRHCHKCCEDSPQQSTGNSQEVVVMEPDLEQG